VCHCVLCVCGVFGLCGVKFNLDREVTLKLFIPLRKMAD